MNTINFNEIDDFQSVELDIPNQEAIPAMFTDYRVDRNSIPKGLFAYDIRSVGTEDFASIEPYVLVNYTGTVIVRQEIPMTEGDYTPIVDYNFVGDITVCEYLA